jgi:putative transposase
MVKNRHLAKSIHDAGWGTFLCWIKYYGRMHDVPVIAVAPQFTSQVCSACGTLVKKSLSVRTHSCTGCGVVLDRDQNAALNILAKALERTVCPTGTDEPDSSNASGQIASTSRLARARGKRTG